MAFVLDKVSEDTFYENILLGYTKILEKNGRIKNVHLERREACQGSEVTAWEQQNRVQLPKDMRDFYLAINGFHLTWSYVFSEQETVQVGLLQLNSISELIPVIGYRTSLSADIKSSGKNNQKLRLQLDNDSKVFALSDVDENSKVCLVYETPRASPTFWLLDSDMNWHFLTTNFKKYLCMGIVHLGLPLWQYCFTSQGVPSWVEQMFLMIAPHLPTSQPNETEDKSTFVKDIQNYHINKLDVYLFKPKRRVSEKSVDILKYRKKH